MKIFNKKKCKLLTKEQKLDFVKMVIGLNIDRIRNSAAIDILMVRDNISKLIVDGLDDPQTAKWYSEARHE